MEEYNLPSDAYKNIVYMDDYEYHRMRQAKDDEYKYCAEDGNQISNKKADSEDEGYPEAAQPDMGLLCMGNLTGTQSTERQERL